jgi:excinuclease ABC subunit A
MVSPILLENVRTHNLKGITCRIPRRRLTVITGVSGSGKSSLAFDTLYAEGQRRYTESLSTYARQFLERMRRPDLDRVSSIPPAIAIEQVNRVSSARSTVGTATDILDYLRLLFAAVGTIRCPDCGEVARRDTPESAAARVAELPEGCRAVVTAPAVVGGRPDEWIEELQRAGYRRIWRDGRVQDLSSATKGARHVDVVVDRIVVGRMPQGRLVAALEEALHLGRGVASVHSLPEGTQALRFRAALACPCGRVFPPPEAPRLSFNSPAGACPECHGFGRIPGFDPERVVPDTTRSLDGGAVAPLELPSQRRLRSRMLTEARARRIPVRRAWSKLTDQQRAWVWEGSGRYRGLNGFFRRLERKRYRMHVRVLLARYRSFSPCPRCDGARLRPEALWVRVGGRNLAELCEMAIPRARAFLRDMFLTPDQRERAGHLLEEVGSRLETLEEVGLGYLTLGRQTRTLSGGECQRINLSASLGSALTDTLYVLDEPTVGLHPRDVGRVISVLRKLVELGNTVVVIEHDRDVIAAADYLIELGPGAGHRGGSLVFEGEPEELVEGATATAAALQARAVAPIRHRRPRAGSIVVRGATENNLRLSQIRLPLRRLVAVTGVSGSGKTTLIRKVLYHGYRRLRGEPTEEGAGVCREIAGTDGVDEMVLIDQSPLGRSSRSNPVTYVKALDGIRQLLAATPAARRARIPSSHFSFNVRGGRCEGCDGAGTVMVEMHFLADIAVTCEECQGRRFQSRPLAIRYRGRNIHEVLEMTVDQAAELFSDHAAIVRRLEPLLLIGLGYLRLGQSTATLSGGEAQRLKLAGHLAGRSGGGRKLFLLDEPTTGLHALDVRNLLQVFERLLEQDHSIVVVEHNPDVILRSDHIIDLGPEGGDGGGTLVVAGSPGKVMECEASHTGRALRRWIESPKGSKAKEVGR